MGKSVKRLNLDADWENLAEGSPEERACFAAIGIQFGATWLSEGYDGIANRLRQKPLLSGYHLAEWIAQNWWRLRWEPRTGSESWRFAHRMCNIGHGYVWPDIAIWSDGERTALVPTVKSEDAASTFRYLNSTAAVMPSTQFEEATDSFCSRVVERLRVQGVGSAELSQLWNQLIEERLTPGFAKYRKLEALMGRNADEIAPEVIELLLRDEQRLGISAIEEVAAEAGRQNQSAALSYSDLENVQRKLGYSLNYGDSVVIDSDWRPSEDTATHRAWETGTAAAKVLRVQLRSGVGTIGDERLCDLLGIDSTVLDPHAVGGAPFAFTLRGSGSKGRVILHSHRQEGRRFEVARLLGDHLMNDDEPLRPATNTYTYRQKAQRAFAAELLCPFQGAFNMLQGDYSDDNAAAVADHYGVSPWTIQHQLDNNRISERAFANLHVG